MSLFDKEIAEDDELIRPSLTEIGAYVMLGSEAVDLGRTLDVFENSAKI